MKLIRLEFRKDGIFSKLLDDYDNLLAYTLEHSFNCKPKIYDGTFTCVRGIHKLDNLIPFDTFEVTGVNEHTGLLFHIGNYNADSDGCILIGSSIIPSNKGQMITNSMSTFSKFISNMIGIDQFLLTVQSPN